jgi:hypothetical protein
MPKTQYYRQCSLRKGGATQVAHIPERFAIEGNVVKIKEQGIWDDGWLVESVGSRNDEMTIIALERLWKRTRKASDI